MMVLELSVVRIRIVTPAVVRKGNVYERRVNVIRPVMYVKKIMGKVDVQQKKREDHRKVRWCAVTARGM